jgi:hypothetical protein
MSIHDPRYNHYTHVRGDIHSFSYETRDELDFKKLLAHRCLELVRTTETLRPVGSQLAHEAMRLFMHHEPREAERFFRRCRSQYYEWLQRGLRLAQRLSVDDALCQDYMSNIRRFRYALHEED